MSSYSGEIQYGKYGFHYSFTEETCRLEISSNEYEPVKQWITKNQNEWVKLHSFDLPEIIMKIGQERPSGRRGTYTYEVDDCFVMWNFKGSHKDEIHRITYYSDVLDYFYRPKKRMLNISKELKNYSNLERKYCPKIKTHDFMLGGKKLKLLFHEVVKHKPYEAMDIEIHNVLTVESEEALTYDEVVKVNIIIKRFLSFVSNSRNTSINRVEVNIDSYWECSTDYIYGHYVINNPKKHILTGIILDYDSISSKISNLLELIYKDDICFISLFQYEDSEISTVDIMNICATFECQFKITYPDYKNTNLERAKAEIADSIKQIVDNRRSDGKNVDKYEEIKHFVKLYNDTLLHRLEHAFADFRKFITKYAVNPDLYLVENYDDIPKLIKDARNKLDHGSKKNEVYTKELVSTITVRIVVYFMILKSAGLRGKSLAKCMNNFFAIPVIVK